MTKSLVVHVRAVFKNKRALTAMQVLLRDLESVAEDFSYRDDVKRAVRAARYAVRNIKLQTEVQS